MKLSFRGVVYESPFSAADVYLIADLPEQYGLLAEQINQIPGLQTSQRFTATNSWGSSPPHSAYAVRPVSAIAPLISPITSILVAVWEAAPPSEARIRPFHFVAKYLFPSQQDAFALLQQYYTAYAALPSGAEGAMLQFFIGVPSSLVKVAASL